MRYFLDTNICIYIMNYRPQSLMAQFREHDPADFGISTVVVSELYYGVEKSQQRARNRQRLAEFLRPFAISSYDFDAARAYGQLRADLERRGQLIGREDMMIAAHALSQGCTLITNNEREFTRVAGLNVVNWSE